MIKKLFLLSSVFFASFLFAQSDATQLSSNQEKTIDKLTVYPNPIINNSEIMFISNTDQKIVLEIKNILGKVVFLKKTNAMQGKNKIPFSKKKLSSGMYIYSIQSDTETISKRLVIR